MADIARAFPSQTERSENHDTMILILAGAGIFAVLVIMAAVLPFDPAQTTDSISILFVP